MSTQYNPSGLFDTIKAQYQLKNDAALAHFLEVTPPVISKMLHGKLRIGNAIIVRLIEAGMTLPEIRAYVPKVTI